MKKLIFIVLCYIAFLAMRGYAAQAGEQKIRYQILFSEDSKYGRFSDALYYDKLPEQEDIDKLKAERVANWITILETPPVELTEEKKIEMILQELKNTETSIMDGIAKRDEYRRELGLVDTLEDLQAQLENIEVKKVELQQKVAALTAVADIKPIEDVKP